MRKYWRHAYSSALSLACSVLGKGSFDCVTRPPSSRLRRQRRRNRRSESSPLKQPHGCSRRSSPQTAQVVPCWIRSPRPWCSICRNGSAARPCLIIAHAQQPAVDARKAFCSFRGEGAARLAEICGTEAEADQSAPRSRMSLAMCSRAFAAGDLAVLACYGEPAQADCSILPARLRAGSKRPFTRACISNWQSDR